MEQTSVWLTLLLCTVLLSCSVQAKKTNNIEDEVFYFVIPDRFSNGDPGNDTGGIVGDKFVNGFDATDSRYYHGGDLKGLTNKLRYLRSLGITAIWMTPPFKNKPVLGNSAAYHGYWATDYTQVDPHWGTNQDLADFIALAHKLRIKVFLDVVINHTADVIRYEQCHNDDGSLLDGLSSCPYLSLADKQENPYSPFIPAGEEQSKLPQWLNDPQYYNNQGDSTFSGESSLYGDFYGLDDLDTQNPAVVSGMIDIFKGWISEFDIDGFRVDTIKHVELSFWQQWVPAIKAHAASLGNDDFFIFGEMFDGLPANLSNYTREGKFPSVLDFGLYYAIKDVVADTQGTDRLAWVFAQDDYYTDGDSDANQLLNFVSNHDVGRIGHAIENMAGQSDGEKLARAQLAQSIMLLSRGVPVIYYGDEQGFTGDGGDADGREDMMPSSVASYNDNDLLGTDASTADANFDQKHPIFDYMRRLIRAYKTFPELSSGKQFVRYSQPEPGIFALSKYGEEKSREVLVLFNTSTDSQNIQLAAMADKYTQVWPMTKAGPKAKAGSIDISVPALSSMAFISGGKIALPTELPEISFSTLSEGAKVSGLLEVAATLTNADDRALPLHRVHFSVSVEGGEFQSLGTDYNPGYKVYFDTSAYSDGTKFTFRAAVDNYADANNNTDITVEKGVLPGIIITFKKPADWAGANIYWWNAAPQGSLDWPGMTMTHLIDDWYQFQFENDVKQANIIFNDGAGKQSADLFREGDACYVDSQWLDTCTPPQPGMTVHFKKPSAWGDNINIYYWDAEPGVSWPGAAMEAIGEGWYKFQFANDVQSASLIFHDGQGNQSADLNRSGNGCYVEAQWLEACVPPVAGIKVYFKKPDNWTTGINIHYWNAAPASGTSWPGEAMQDEGNDWYSYQFPLNVVSANLIFNDGEGQQSADLLRDANGCYVDNGWQETCDTSAQTPGMTVYVHRPLSWNVPNIYFWEADGAPAWPGIEMDSLGDDWYRFQFAAGVNSANIIFNDLTGNQTGDLYREGDGCYDIETQLWSDSCAIPGFTVYFQKPVDWATAFTYFWNPRPALTSTPGWPGEAMTELGENWLSYQFPNGVEATNLIFNNGGAGQQTADLFREGEGCYTLAEGWTDSCALPVQGMEVYFKLPAGWSENVNLYYWNAAGAPGWPGLPMTVLGDGWYSFTFPQGVDAANLIFNDGNGQQTADLQISGGGCYGEFGDNWRKSCITPEKNNVSIANVAAHWLTQDTMAWQVNDSRATAYRLYFSATASLTLNNGELSGYDGFVQMTASGNIEGVLAEQDPQLAAWSAYSMALDAASAKTMLQSQLVAVAMDSGGNVLEATRVQTPRVVDALFATTDWLGVQYDNGLPSLRLWAPTAQSVKLVRYDSVGNKLASSEADSVTDGVYHFSGTAEWDKQYYRYEITVYHPKSNAIETYEVSDPYALNLSENGQFSQLVDLANDETLKPDGWDGLQKVLPQHKDITLYEGHIRDFSVNDLTVPAADRGKYLAFSYNGLNGKTLSDGMAHLQGLQQAGLSHFHLLPVFDISSINEDPTQRVDLDDPFSLLCALVSTAAVQDRCAAAGETSIREVLTELKDSDAANAEIQAIVADGNGMTGLDGFNWGYDPHHFNAPEGSYASDAAGTARVLEFRTMVKSLADINLNVVMDVVYNHTSASGLYDNSVLDKVVPGYYQRLNPVNGQVENSSCCDNTASEHQMMEKLMVDTLVNWALFYKVDSFRFDLMGHIPKSAMVAAQAALADLNLANDGVDGEKIYLYGEGWDFGEVAGGQRFTQATQFNMAGTGIGTFNDRIRDAIRGGNFSNNGAAQGWANGNETFANGVASGASSLSDQADRIRIGMAGNLQSYPFVDNSGNVNTGLNYAGVGYTLDPQESVNYVDKHDNESLWDNTQGKLPASMGVADRVRVHMLSNALINFGQGIPFYQLGTDLLRSKSMDRNSYNSGDWFNAVDFSAQSNNWAVGLPPSQDNQGRWGDMADLLNNGNIVVSPAQIALASRQFKEQLAIRYSSPLFRLDSAEQVNTRLGFHNTGTSQQQGIIAMTLSDGVCAGEDLDLNYDGILVLFNSDDAQQSFSLPGTEGSLLHPVQLAGSDEVVKTSVLVGDTYTIPAHTAAVFVLPQSGVQGDYPCNPQAGSVSEPGLLVYVQKPADWQDMRIHYWNTSVGATDWPGAELQAIGDNWYSFQFPADVTAANMIFNNNNNGLQTSDLYRDSEGCFDIAADIWADS